MASLYPFNGPFSSHLAIPIPHPDNPNKARHTCVPLPDCCHRLLITPLVSYPPLVPPFPHVPCCSTLYFISSNSALPRLLLSSLLQYPFLVLSSSAERAAVHAPKPCQPPVPQPESGLTPSPGAPITTSLYLYHAICPSMAFLDRARLDLDI
ncbi:hypothetical protein BGY98DRAFT_368990 [Russula aff. rugulosa BPL654]|nr:hypothetical protein BGY98DRAFT_368990 [Russula aff. rugulosa BPL654]